MTTDRKKKWENEWEGEEWWLLSPHPLWSGAVTLLPPPTWKIILRPHTHTHAHTHTHTHTHWEWQKIPYLCEALLCLFVSTPINPALVAPHHMLATLNSWAAGLLAAVVLSNFQSGPPQRKRSLTLAIQHLPSHQPLSYRESLLRPVH